MRNKINNKKGVVDKVFVYIFSIVIIAFCGFLVTKFVYTFMNDVDTKINQEFYEKVEKDYTTVYRTQGSEKTLKYKVHEDVEYVCFLPNLNCIDKVDDILKSVENYDNVSLSKMIESGKNIITYDKNDIINSRKINTYTSDKGCFCIKPKLGKFELTFENRRNKVVIN